VPLYTLGGVKKQAYYGYETWGVSGNKEGVGIFRGKLHGPYNPVDTKFQSQDRTGFSMNIILLYHALT